MRILLVSNLYPPYWVGGYELQAAWVAEGLRERGHVVDVLTGRGPAFAERPDIHGDLDLDLPALCAAHESDGIAFADGLGEAWRRHVFSRWNFRACRRLLERTRHDLVSFWNPAFITFSPLLAARRMRVPAVVHLSDTSANAFRNPHPPAVPAACRGAARVAVDGLLRFSGARRLVVPSAFLGAKLAREQGLGAPRVVALHWPVEPGIGRAAAPARPEARASRLLFVGGLTPEKGTCVLIESFREAWRQRPDLTLTLVGAGGRDHVARLREAAVGLPVRFLGRLGRAEVLAAYKDHDVLVFPSTWDEPFALVPLEAMAVGLAVIATAAGGTPEAVAHEKTGLLVPPGDRARLSDAILRLARDPALARALGDAGQAWVRETHGFAPFMDRLTDLYEEARTSRGGLS